MSAKAVKLRKWLETDIIQCLLLYSTIWFVLGSGQGWLFGLPAVMLAAAAALWLGLAPWRIRFRRLPRFLLFFVSSVLAGAWDVARSALWPGLAPRPGWTSYRMRSHSQRVRVLLFSIINLLPGTLAARREGDTLRIHLLVESRPWEGTVRQLEDQLSGLIIPESDV